MRAVCRSSTWISRPRSTLWHSSQWVIRRASWERTVTMKMDAQTLRDRIARLDLSGIDFGAFRSDPVSPAGIRVLRYIHDVEFHTVCYLRDLLMTSVHRDPDITSF